MNLEELLKTVGPTECSRANNRRPADGTRYIESLEKRIKELNKIAAHAGLVIVVQENKKMDYTDKLTADQLNTLSSITADQARAVHALILVQEESEAHKNDIPISDLFESAFISAFM